MLQDFLSLHLDSGLALCVHVRAHTHTHTHTQTHTVPSMENFIALVLVCRFLCFYRSLSVISAFLPFRNSSEFLAAFWLVWSLSRHPYTMSFSWSFSHLPAQPLLGRLRWGVPSALTPQDWPRASQPGNGTHLLPESVPFFYITPHPQTRMAFPFIIVDIWDWNTGGRASNINLSDWRG